MKQIIIINGPNLNLLGKREVSIYGASTFESFFEDLKIKFPHFKLEYYQNNSEGKLIDKLHDVGFSHDGVVLNAGAYTHTSIAIADAIRGIQTPVVEVHISNVYKRENYRHHSFLSANCKGVIVGFGLKGYELALNSFSN